MNTTWHPDQLGSSCGRSCCLFSRDITISPNNRLGGTLKQPDQNRVHVFVLVWDIQAYYSLIPEIWPELL